MGYELGKIRTDRGEFKDKGNQVFDVTHPDFGNGGARGDGVVDDTLAIQDAIEAAYAAGGGVVFVPPVAVGSGRFYRITTQLVMRSNVDLRGNGFASHIKNVTDSTGDAGRVVAIGTYGGSDANGPIGLETWYALDAATIGAFDVVCSTAAEAANFAAGDIVAIRDGTAAEVTTHTVPTYSEINEVESVSGATITLKQSLQNTYNSGTEFIAKLANGNFVRNASIRNLQLGNTAANMQQILAGGSWGLTLADLWVTGGGHAIIGSVNRDILIERCYATHTGSGSGAFDFGYLSHGMTIRDCRVDHMKGSGNQFGLRIEERVYDFHVDNMTVCYTGSTLSAGVGGITVDLGSYCGKITNCRVYVDGTANGIGINVAGTTVRDVLVHGNVVRGCQQGIRISGVDCEAKGNYVIDNQLGGSKFALLVAGTRNRFINNTVMRTSGTLDTTSDTISDSGTGTIAYGNETATRASGVQTKAYAATVTPKGTESCTVEVGTLTGNVTIGAPTQPTKGSVLTFAFTQDGTGGRTVTWNAAFKANWTPDTAAGKVNTISFYYNGTNWIQTAVATGL